MNSIPATIEASPKHVIDGKLNATMLPVQTRVYITDVGIDPLDEIVRAAKMVNDMGYTAVPHVPARRIEGPDALEERLQRLTEEASVNDILIIAGEGEQAGSFDQSLQVLQTGLVDKYGIKDVGIAGHPEGNQEYKGQDPFAVLKAKLDFFQHSDATPRVVTQFGFDGELFVEWANTMADKGIETPIHLGVAGPAKITTLIKYAAMCGVGNSLNFFKKRTSAIAQLATKHSPEDVVGPIEAASRESSNNITHIHVFPFGGLQSSADWLSERGSFVLAKSA